MLLPWHPKLKVEVIERAVFLYQGEGSFKLTSPKSFVQILRDSTNRRMNDLTREVQDLKNSLQFTQGELDVLKETCSKPTTNWKSSGDDIGTVCQSLLTHLDW
jgi:hypothetical protein